MHVNEDECKAAGLDIEEVSKIANGLTRYARQAEKLGMHVFGGSCDGEVRFVDDPNKGALKVAVLDGNFDGGDGGDQDWGDGLLRGE